MGRTFRKNLKKELMAPFLVYLIRKWKFNSKNNNQEETDSWADWKDTDLPRLPESWREHGLLSPGYDRWLRENYPPNDTYIKITNEYTYRNS